MYQDVIGQISPMLASVDRAVRADGAEHDPELMLGYVSAYVVTAKLLTKVGAADLAMLAGDRAANKAMEADSMVARGMSAYQVACALLRADRSDDAEHLAVNMAEQIQAKSRSDEPVLVSLSGAMWLIGTVIAARRLDRDEAWARLDQADALADLLGEDANHAWTAFGPTNVALRRVSVAAEMGDPGEALRVAASVNTDELPEGLTSRRAQVHTSTSHGPRRRESVTRRQSSTC